MTNIHPLLNAIGFRVSTVASGVSATIAGLAISGDAPTSDNGKPRISSYACLTLREVLLTRTNSGGPQWSGGVFNNERGTLAIIDSTAPLNTPSHGGGLMSASTGSVAKSGSTFNNIEPTVEGGAIYLGGIWGRRGDDLAQHD